MGVRRNGQSVGVKRRLDPSSRLGAGSDVAALVEVDTVPEVTDGETS